MKHDLGKIDTADSQFFIILGDAHHLDGQYTVWGRVIYGMEFTDLLLRGQPPLNPDLIERIRVLADIPTFKVAEAENAR
jgi:cyclophilin family peptidyl-prolyl cis-trans isomerase